VENLNYILATKYRAWSLGGQKIVWASHFKERQGAIKLISNHLDEIETQFENLRENGLLVLQTNCNLINLTKLFKDSQIDYITKGKTKQLIIIKK